MPSVLVSVRIVVLLAASMCASASVVGCASGPPPGPPPTAAEIEVVDAPAEVSSLLLTVYPTPRQAAYGSFLLPLDGHRRVEVGADDFLEVLEDFELLDAWRELPHEGYVLQVGWHDDRTVVVVAGADETGTRWADQALTQLTTVDAAGRSMVRDCLIIDAPAFPLRGSKRPQVWEEGYRANFAWGAKDDDAYTRRAVVPFFAPGSPLDATPEGLKRALDTFGPWQAAGARRFAIKFDDVGFALTPQSQLRFGTYARALVVYISAIRSALRSVDPEAELYYLPQTYWWNDERFETFSAAVRGSGGLPPDVGLVLTGPEIVSDDIDAAGLDAARGAFGATVASALIYDNLGREGDWGPLTGRDPALVDVADAVFGERGTPVNRLTRLDWAWNPTGYDPERSWRRALLELAGPVGYVAFRDACAAFREGAEAASIERAIDAFEQAGGTGSAAGPLPHVELVRLLRDDLRRLTERTGTR